MLSPIGTWDQGKEALSVEPASALWQATAAPEGGPGLATALWPRSLCEKAEGQCGSREAQERRGCSWLPETGGGI